MNSTRPGARVVTTGGWPKLCWNRPERREADMKKGGRVKWAQSPRSINPKKLHDSMAQFLVGSALAPTSLQLHHLRSRRQEGAGAVLLVGRRVIVVRGE